MQAAALQEGWTQASLWELSNFELAEEAGFYIPQEAHAL